MPRLLAPLLALGLALAQGLDTRFGQGGAVTLHAGLELVDLHVQGNGGLMLLLRPREQNALVLQQLLPDGRADSRFAQAGAARVAGAAPLSLARSGDGSWLVLRADQTLVRLTSAGRLDGRFGRGGVLALPTPRGYHFNQVFVGDDSSIFLAGLYPSAGSSALAVARLNPGGQLDRGYGFGGVNRAAPTVTAYRQGFLLEGNRLYLYGDTRRLAESPYAANGIAGAGFDGAGFPEQVGNLVNVFDGAALAALEGAVYYASNDSFDATDHFVWGGGYEEPTTFRLTQWPGFRASPGGDREVLFAVQGLLAAKRTMIVGGRMYDRKGAVLLRLRQVEGEFRQLEWQPDPRFGDQGIFELPSGGHIQLLRPVAGGAYLVTRSPTSGDAAVVRVWRVRL